ncbi:MAG TPA: glycosyltransferase [Rhodopila sp.]|nr:glycosyltransferase [Rhodopila sp.]
MTVLAFLSLAIWVYLLLFHGRFWQAGPVLSLANPKSLPTIAIVVPARNEAPVIEQSLASLLAQDYPGPFHVYLVDDNSDDRTGDLARGLGHSKLTVLTGTSRPPGWSGKLWAVRQGVEKAAEADAILLTDADVIHDPPHLRTLVAHMDRCRLDMVSEMVALACESRAERALVPAFVLFFQLLYPFAWVNDGLKSTAAAAGGTILIRTAALNRIGGIDALKGALIDDVALAAAVKKGGMIWLGHACMARSVRPYPDVIDIWKMITRTAFVQLRYSASLLVLTTLAMILVWLVPPIAALSGHGAARWYGATAWLMLACSYIPTLHRFGRLWIWAPALPIVALFYLAATIASAVNHYTGRGVAWKGRAYQGQEG